MNKKIIDAWNSGKQIEAKAKNGVTWFDILQKSVTTNIKWQPEKYDYRIKPDNYTTEKRIQLYTEQISRYKKEIKRLQTCILDLENAVKNLINN